MNVNKMVCLLVILMAIDDVTVHATIDQPDDVTIDSYNVVAKNEEPKKPIKKIKDDPKPTPTPTPEPTPEPTSTVTPTPEPTSTVTPTPEPTTSHSSGGSSQNNNIDRYNNIDNYDNIERFEMVTRNLIINRSIEFNFTTQELSIYQILINNKENEYDVSMRIEDLKNISKYANPYHPGIIYRNENVMITGNRMNYISVRFKVENSWIENNNNSGDNKIYLLKWIPKIENDTIKNGKWLVLLTNITKKDGTYTYFESPKAGNSRINIFAVNSLSSKTSNVESVEEEEEEEYFIPLLIYEDKKDGISFFEKTNILVTGIIQELFKIPNDITNILKELFEISITYK